MRTVLAGVCLLVGFATSTAAQTVYVDPSATVNADEGSPVAFTLSRVGNVTDAVTVSVAVTETGDMLADPVPTTVTFAAGFDTATLSVMTEEDAEDEEDSTVTVTLMADPSDPATYTLGSAPGLALSAEALVSDNDDPMAPVPPVLPTVYIDPNAVVAGDEGSPVAFTLSRVGNVTDAVTVSVAVTETGHMLADPVPTTVTFAAGFDTATLSVMTEEDAEDEDDSTVTVELVADPTAYTLGSAFGLALSAEALVTDNDGPVAPVTPALSTVYIDASATVDADEGSPVAFTLARVGNVTDAVSVSVEVTETGDMLARPVPTTVTFAAGVTTAVLRLMTVRDEFAETDSVVTVTLEEDPSDPATYTLGSAPGLALSAKAQVTDAGGASLLEEGRRLGAATLLRRHVQRFSQLSSDVALGRLEGRRTESHVDVQVTNESRRGSADLSFGLRSGWEGWSSLRYSRLDGSADGEVWDVFVGADYLSADGRSVYGVLLGYEPGRVTAEDVRLEAEHVQLGVYGAYRLSERLIFDGAIGWGRGENDLSLVSGPEVTASYGSERVTVRGDLTGDFGWGDGSLRIEPQLGLLYAEESLDGFTDSVGGVAAADRLWLARVGFGPQLVWSQPESSTHLQLRVNLDAHNLDGTGERREEVSAAVEAGHRWQIDARSSLDLSGSVDGLGSGWFSSGSLGLQYNLDF